MKKRQILVISQAVENPVDPSAVEINHEALYLARMAIKQEGIVFDLVLGIPGRGARQTASVLAPNVTFAPINFLVEDLGREVDRILIRKNPGSILIILFPPVTNQIILYLRSEASDLLRKILSEKPFASGEGWLLQDVLEAGRWLAGFDRPFPPKDLPVASVRNREEFNGRF